MQKQVHSISTARHGIETWILRMELKISFLLLSVGACMEYSLFVPNIRSRLLAYRRVSNLCTERLLHAANMVHNRDNNNDVAAVKQTPCQWQLQRKDKTIATHPCGLFFVTVRLTSTKPNTGKLQYIQRWQWVCVFRGSNENNCFSTYYYFRETNKVNDEWFGAWCGRHWRHCPHCTDFSINRKIIINNKFHQVSSDWMKNSIICEFEMGGFALYSNVVQMNNKQISMLNRPKSKTISRHILFFFLLVATRGRLRNQRPWMRK